MLVVKSLDDNYTASSLQEGSSYLGIVEDETHVRLNKKILCELPDSKLNKGDQVAVKISTISLPDKIVATLIKDNFTVEVERSSDFACLSIDDVDKKVKAICKVEGIVQTKGPTIFTLNDATGNLRGVAFSKSPGERAYKDIENGDIIKVEVKVTDRDGKVEAKINYLRKAEKADEEIFKKKLDESMAASTQPECKDFLINSERLTKIRPYLEACSSAIKKAILEGRQVLLRHHADADGYSGGIALERAIHNVMKVQHGESNAGRNYRRMPNRAPYYDYFDALKDISYAQGEKRYGRNMPLIILCDFGSGQENVLAIKRCQTYDIPIIIIDHHEPRESDEESSLDLVEFAVNPYLYDMDESLTAGMLAIEISRMISGEVHNLEPLAAISAIGDRSESPEAEEYFKLADEAGYPIEKLKKLVGCIDFDAFNLGHMEGRGIIDDLLGEDKELQDKIIEAVSPVIEKKRAQIKETALHLMNQSMTGKDDSITKITVELNNLISRGKYPSPGRSLGMLMDHLEENEKLTEIIALGYGKDFITLRASKTLIERGFNVNTFAQDLRSKFPWANVDGGGHPNAGTIRFVPGAFEDISKALNILLSQL